MSAKKIKIGDIKRSDSNSDLIRKAPGPKKKGGRPKKKEEELLTKKTTVSFTQAEYDQIVKASADTYLPVSILIRKCLKDAGIIS